MVSAGEDCPAKAEQGSIEPSAAAQTAEWIRFRKATEGYHGLWILAEAGSAQKKSCIPLAAPTI
jgi:hypothetical protein